MPKTRNSTKQDFEHLSFHGSKITALHLGKQNIQIHLERVYMPQQHAANTTNNKLCLHNCILKFNNAVQSEANVNVYIPEQTIKDCPHIVLRPEFEIPIKDLVSIIKSEHINGLTRFLIMGYYWVQQYQITGWAKWEVIAPGFELQWQSAEPVGQVFPHDTVIA